jgi:CBS domain-containing protein
MKTVGDVMSTGVLTVKHTATLGQVARTMRERNVGSALVVDDGKHPIGMISERELVESVANSRNPDVGTAQSWMRETINTIAPDTPISVAVELMREQGVRHLPVGNNGDVQGVVSIRDLLAGVMLYP